MSSNYLQIHFTKFTVQLDGGQFQEQSQEYVRWKEWRDKVAVELRQSVSTILLFCLFLLYYLFYINNIRIS